MTEPASLITEAELDLSIVEVEDRFLKVPIVFRELVTVEGGEELGDWLSSEIVRFPIRGSLPVPMMTTFLRLETRINNALAADDETADRELEHAMDDAHRRIVGLIVEKTPSALRQRTIEHDGAEKPVKPGIELDVSQILVTLSWLAGDVSVADAVARALTAGRSPARTEAEILAEAPAAEGSAEAPAPLP